MKRIVFLILTVCVALPGCRSESVTGGNAGQLKKNYIDQSVQDHHNLGWLGARSNPVAESIGFSDPDSPDDTVSPGAIVLREVLVDCAADRAGLRVGDVIVRIGEEWLPIKDDPTSDFLNELEALITAGAAEINLGFLRNGDYQTLAFAHGLNSIDDGLPAGVARIDEAADRALNRLVTSQQEDGSFGSREASDTDRLLLTSLAGLAMLASGNQNLNDKIEKCLDYVGSQIDDRSIDPPEPEKTANEQPGIIRMTSADVDLDALTAAYVLQFLAESRVQMMSAGWMKRITGITGSLIQSQSEAGGWSPTAIASELETDSTEADVVGTHTTNQVLLALGAWERKGMMSQPEVIKNACGYLRNQTQNRLSGKLDRRIRSALSAGTASAMVAINCHPADPFLKKELNRGLERAADLHKAPALGTSGLLSIAMAARASGNDNWIRFHHAVRIPVMSMLAPDGTFHAIPGNQTRNVIGLEKDPVWQAAHLSLVLAMQRGHLKRMTGQQTTPMQVARNSSGENFDGTTHHTPGVPEGAQVMTFSMDDLSGEGSIEDQLKEKLKEMGLPTDGIQMKGLPDGDGPDSKDHDKQ